MDNKNIYEVSKRLGIKIRKLRKEQGYSQETFAEKIGIHRTYMGAVERGEKNITIITAKKIANALKITLSELLNDI
ncbi:helix-turn-helix domain-containing protein [Dethiothermospora halolimnae]|uniref:helix-turn-helix domain-containing protein n=1 Tax=Dethiothermospora halolimnae TaxID=3114390 RepID=UPI003CCB92AE